MKTPQPPRLETRRRREFLAELQERARAWIPAWEVSDNEGDFGRALLEIAARFNSEVAERLDIAGEKMRRGFLDWLAVRREAARPSRMPVVFKLIDAAVEPVLASAPVRMQADAGGSAVVFETEKDVRVIPGLLDTVVGADADADAFYLPPPGLSDLKPLQSLPSQWQAKSFASKDADKIQLDPELGLVAGMLIRAGGKEYRIVAVDKDLVQIDPPLESDLAEGSLVSKVATFSPFGGEARNWQEHVLYIGDSELLNIEAPATIEVVGAFDLRENFTWEYWGKRGTDDEITWQPLEVNQDPKKDKTDAAVLLKPQGSVEEKLIGGKKSRWIRAYTKNVKPAQDRLTSDEFSLRVNSSGCEDDQPCSFDDKTPSPLAEGFANTTPLVLDNIFFPLGKEPRQFDAFYLGSQEAFSKPNARVQLCFQMADPTFSAVTAVREGTMKNQVLVGVARDRALHLLSFDATGRIGKFRDRDPLQPPGITPLALDPQPPWRLPVWPDDPDFFTLQGFSVGTSARNSIWVWHEHSVVPTASRWIDFGTLPADAPVSDAPVDGLVFLNGTPPVLAALREGRLFVRSWPSGTQWDQVNTRIGTTTIRLKSIVPVLVRDPSGNLVTATTAGLLGIDENNELFEVALDGTCTSPLSAFDFDPAIRPVAVEVGTVRTIAAVTKPANPATPPELVAHNSTTPQQVPLGVGSKVLVGLEAIVVGASTVQILATVRESSGSLFVTWAPFETGPAASVFKSPPVTGGLLEGAPTRLNDFVIIPGSSADLFVISFDPTLRLLKTDDIDIGVVLPAAIATLVVNDLMVRLVGGAPVRRRITAPVRTRDAEDFYPIISDFPDNASGLLAYKRSETFSGSFGDPDLTLDDADLDTTEDDWLLIDDDFFRVDSIRIESGHRIATLAIPNPEGEHPTSDEYVRPIDTRGRVAPFMHLNTSAGGSGDWDADLLRRVPLLFPDLTPESQRAKAFSVSVSNKPIVVVMAQEFEGLVANPVDFLVDAAFGEWRRNASDTSTNPELSWEYWNGKGWWKLDITRDETQNLKATGALRFVVPIDIASSDWAGRTNFWIRGRLVGGDYGKETVTVTIKQVSATESEQTVNRSLEGISPPSVLKLHIAYAICDGIVPAFVLTQDSGAIRDQSDANRTPGAIVEAFVPLALTLGKLSQSVASSVVTTEKCPPECDCSEQQTALTETQPAASGTTVVTTGPAGPLATGRSLFIGLAATPSEAPVNVLLLVEERDHTRFAPMKVEALIANTFQPIVVDDTTRALGESGLLSMSFPVSPTPSELFGKTLTWLRLIPKANATDQWVPTLRGAYLNAAWASATETLTRELLGSSDGAPNLTVRLARPPVLRDTLELRIKEPLGEEEREALVQNDSNKVVNLPDLPGDWVLWTQVVDPNDASPDARVYALDEASGEIRFGDGTHGRIPPIGRDAIVAFKYSRTETGQTGDSVPGNTIGPRTALNLVSPVQTVETVTSADQAAGGASAEPDNRVLRFGFARVRHRNRAVTPRDLEDLALQSSPDIVQARAIVRRGYIKLVVVMRGDNPQPTAAQVRELRRLLLDAAPAALSAQGALRIEGPGVRRLQIELALRVETLDHAGELGELVKSQLTRLFDTGLGGVDGDGWPLGLNPTEDDIAYALIDAPHLESIAGVKRREVSDGNVRDWPETLKETEIAMLADDPVRIEFETAEVFA